MPSEIRDELAGKFYIGRGIGCLCIFTEGYLNNYRAQMDLVGGPMASLMDPNVAQVNRHLFAEMAAAKSDGQSRTPLTAQQKQYAGITNEVVIVGCGDYLELWSPERWNKYKERYENDAGVVAAGTSLLSFLLAKSTEQADGAVSPTGPA
jgi:MraZ protein